MLAQLSKLVQNTNETQPYDCSIERWLVRSSIVSSIGYDHETEVLQIEYPNGFVFEANGVRDKQYERLMSASDFDQAYRTTILREFELSKVGYEFPILAS